MLMSFNGRCYEGLYKGDYVWILDFEPFDRERQDAYDESGWYQRDWEECYVLPLKRRILTLLHDRPGLNIESDNLRVDEKGFVQIMIRV